MFVARPALSPVASRLGVRHEIRKHAFNKRLIDYQDVHSVPQYRVEEVRQYSPAAYFSPLFEAFQLKNGKWAGECAYFVRTVMGWAPMGDARFWKPTTSYPVVGGVVVFDYNHVAIVAGVVGDSLALIESNYKGDKRISVGRTVKIGDESILGYIPPWKTMAVR